MSDRYLRYYAPTYDRERHELWIRLLNRIQSDHGISWEEVPTGSEYGSINQDWYSKEPETTEPEVWEGQLSRNRAIALNDVEERTPSKKFKSNSGNFQIKGMVAVIDSQQGVIHGSRHSAGTDFLEEILEDGYPVLDRLAATGDEGKSIHKQLIESYEDQVDGQTFREYSVGESLVETSEYSTSQKRFAKNIVSKKIDLVVRGSKNTEIIEAKGEFNANQVEKALGQLLYYQELYEKEHPEEKVKLKAIFPEPSFGLFGETQMVGASEAIESMKEIFSTHDITVLFRSENGTFHRAK